MRVVPSACLLVIACACVAAAEAPPATIGDRSPAIAAQPVPLKLAETTTLDPAITAPMSAAEQAKRFVVPKGFEIELVATEPLVFDPVTIAFDDAGRLYVSESHTYRYGEQGSPVKPHTNPIVRLNPRPDGTLEREVVAEGFDDPAMGIAIRGDSMWVAANNYLYRYTLPATGPATNRTLLVEDKVKAWNPIGNFNLEFGPDGLLYMSVGNHDIQLQGPTNKITCRNQTGLILRMKPDGSDMELLNQGWPIWCRHRGSIGIAITASSRRTTGCEKPSRRWPSATSASGAMPRLMGMRSADMRRAEMPPPTAATHATNRPPTTPPGLRGPNSWPGWGRSFRWSARGVVATSGSSHSSPIRGRSGKS